MSTVPEHPDYDDDKASDILTNHLLSVVLTNTMSTVPEAFD